MNTEKPEQTWERTSVTNLVRNAQNATYYARVKFNGKEKWKSLKTTTLSVAKLRLADFERDLKAVSTVATQRSGDTGSLSVGHFMAAFQTQSQNDPSLAPATKSRRVIALKAIRKTWPELEGRDVRRVTAKDCQNWAARALREGTGFVAPNAKTKRQGMSGSAFNKCLECLQAVFRLACDEGAAYGNPADSVSRAKLKAKRLDLPPPGKFHELARAVEESGSRHSRDCADMVRLLAFSGLRLREATALRWRNVDWDKKLLTVPGTKSASSFRHIPLFPPLEKLLREMQARREDVLPDAPVLLVGECKGALRSACTLVGIARLTHHDLRHLFATMCIQSKVDIPTVARWLGHSDGGALAMRTYGHFQHEHSQSEAQKVTFGLV